MNSKSSHFRHLCLILDNTGGVLAWLLAINIAIFAGILANTDFYQQAALLLLVIPLQLWSFYANSDIQLNLKAQAAYLGKSIALVVMILVAITFVSGFASVERMVLLTYAVLSFTGLFMTRGFLFYWYFKGRKERQENYTKILIVGSGPRAQMVAQKLQQPGGWGTEIIGYIDPHPESNMSIANQSTNIDTSNVQASALNGTQINGTALNDSVEAGSAVSKVPQVKINHADDILKILSANVVDEVVIAIPRKLLSDVEFLVQVCEEEGICIKLVADIFDVKAARTDLSVVDGLPLLEFHPVSQNPSMLIVKRIFDLVATIAAIPILVPLFIVLGIIVRLDSPGPIFFKQARVGLNKRQFNMYKFRSMYADAEQRLAEIEHLNEADGPNFKIASDPRVTKVGAFIRKTSLDELPQLVNVFLGHMSLVGPRPMSLRDVNLFDKSVQRRRFSVRPGCTCTWQISGRSNLTFEQWLELDLAYIDNWRFFEDIKILFKTIPSIIRGSGAV